MSENTKARRGPGHGPMRGGHGPMMAGEKAKDFKGSLKKLFNYLKPFRIHLLVIVLFAAASTVFSIIGPKILAKATDELAAGMLRAISGAGGGIDFGYIGKIVLLLVGLYLLSSLFSYIQGYIMAGVSSKVSYNLRKAIMSKINRLPMSFFNRTSHGEVLSRITNDIDTLSQGMNQSITQFCLLYTSRCV